jgi:hypothetical protein
VKTDRLATSSLALGALAVWGGVLLWRLYGLSWQFASNVPFSDQWTLWGVLFDGFQWGDFWRAYQFQHGPHRQGLSFALMVPFYHLSHWNIRFEALVIASIQVLSGLLALRLRIKLLGKPLSAWDGILLAAFWGTLAYETIILAPNASHSIAPLALLLMWANVWLAPVAKWRTVLLLGLTHALCFTGFGLLAMPALVFTLALQVWRGPQALRVRNAVLLAGALLAMAHFSVGYVFNPAVDNFDGHHPALPEYLGFLSALLQYFFQFQVTGAPEGWYLMGGTYLLAMCGVGLYALLRLLGLENRSPLPVDEMFWSVVLLLAGTTITFAAMTTYGRTLLGLPAAYASRYMVLLLPGFLGLYLVAFKARKRTWIPLLVLALLMVARQGPEYRRSWKSGELYGGIKACWLQTYLQTGSFDRATEKTKLTHPEIDFQPIWMGSPGQWEYLEQHELGPFSAFSRQWGVTAFRPSACQP